MPSASLPSRKQNVSHEESIEEYADRVLSQVFRITTDPAKTTDAHGHKLTLLPDLSAEQVDNGEALLLSATVLDSALLEACTAWPADRPLLHYLIPCWKRVIRALSGVKEAQQQKRELLIEAKRLCMSNCLFALTMPTLYGCVPSPFRADESRSY